MPLQADRGYKYQGSTQQRPNQEAETRQQEAKEIVAAVVYSSANSGHSHTTEIARPLILLGAPPSVKLLCPLGVLKEWSYELCSAIPDFQTTPSTASAARI